MHLYGIGFVVAVRSPYRYGVQGVRGPWAPMHAVFRPKYLARCVRAASLRGGFSSTAVC